MADPEVVAACGFVIPRHVNTLWERGRYVEYLMAFTFYKEIQEYYQKPLISSGCFSMHHTDFLQRVGGWSLRTMAEDMDLTWTAYHLGNKVRPSLCYVLSTQPYSWKRCLKKSFYKSLWKYTKRGINMNAGLPGAGIGGHFYLLCALATPIKEV
jgi:cellulose synthase/poly-beta-1,6-N-acetylglucosamine synthase-like glycosyltransferase